VYKRQGLAQILWKQNSLQVQWWYLTGWDPRTIPLQFSATMALSACLQKQKESEKRESNRKRMAIVCMNEWDQLGASQLNVSQPLLNENLMQTIPSISGERTFFLNVST
jgi:hypothetical protein